MKKKRENWTKLYHKTLKEIEVMIDVQRMVKDIKKIAEETNTTMCQDRRRWTLFIFIFSLLFFFFFFLLFSISIFRTTQVRGYQSHCHISHNLMA